MRNDIRELVLHSQGVHLYPGVSSDENLSETELAVRYQEAFLDDDRAVVAVTGDNHHYVVRDPSYIASPYEAGPGLAYVITLPKKLWKKLSRDHDLLVSIVVAV